MAEYISPFTEAREEWDIMKAAHFNFRRSISNIHLTCPACKKMATLNHDGASDSYWISCTMCGLRTSSSTNFDVVTYQWDAICQASIDSVSCVRAAKQDRESRSTAAQITDLEL